ncbi:hypothetical protein, partial [Niallia nealsonii]|uniref:hypothetical protein n=1 Tax=Niallia nealsonii TaxID=115979 RepID=UPI0019636F9E
LSYCGIIEFVHRTFKAFHLALLSTLIIIGISHKKVNILSKKIFISLKAKFIHYKTSQNLSSFA